MNWAWVASSLDQLWRSPSLPLWITLAAAGFFAAVLLVTLARAQKSVANGALVVLALVAVGIAASVELRRFGQPPREPVTERAASPFWTSVPALACLDGLAGEAVEAACEKPLFSSPESSAAAVAYTADQITRLARADQAAGDRPLPPDMASLRHALERDRYGLVSHVLSVRDGCNPTDCGFYKSVGDHGQISAHMAERTYEGVIGRYVLGWNPPPPAAPVVAAPVTLPTGRPMSGDFPSASSIPPVSIMTPEPGTTASAPKQAAASPRPATSPAASPPAPKRPPRKPPPPPPAPEPVAPAPTAGDN